MGPEVTPGGAHLCHATAIAIGATNQAQQERRRNQFHSTSQLRGQSSTGINLLALAVFRQCCSIYSEASRTSKPSLRNMFTYVSGTSTDGSVVVGVWGNEGPAWRWTAQTGVVDIGGVSHQVEISRDGRTIVGKAKDNKR